MTNYTKITELMLENSVKFGEKSFELENRRNESLQNQASKNLTAISIFLSAIAFLKINSIPLLCCIFVSFLFSVLAGFRFKYRTFDDAKGFLEEFKNNCKTYQNQWQFDFQMIYQLESIQKSLKMANDKRLNMILISFLFFVVSVTIFLGILIYGN
jgi:hypothetical protein